MNKAMEYLTEKEGRYIYREIDNGNNAKMVSRYNGNEYHCEYSGEDLGDSFITTDISQALEWFYK